jgi:hypothetical protein
MLAAAAVLQTVYFQHLLQAERAAEAEAILGHPLILQVLQRFLLAPQTQAAAAAAATAEMEARELYLFAIQIHSEMLLLQQVLRHFQTQVGIKFTLGLEAGV